MKIKQSVLTEEQECIALAQYLTILQRQGKIVKFTHIPNSTWTKSWNQKRKNTRMGLVPGFPDYVIIAKDKMICIEMKRKKLGKLSSEQKEWIDSLSTLTGVFAYVCYGFDDAQKIIKSHAIELII